MPRDLFGDIVQPSAGLGSRKWYTLPLSLFIHAVALAAVVIAPLMAAGVLPAPNHVLPEFLQVVPAAPPDVPPAARPRPAAAQPPLTTNSGAAPLDAPTGVGVETGVVESQAEQTGVEGGLLNGIDGSIVAGLEEPPPAPPVLPTPTAPIRMHSGVRPPTKVHDVIPNYPLIAIQARVQGVVILEAVIGSDGHVREAKVLRSIPLLDQAALDAVRRWSFTPALLNGEPVPVIMTVTVSFKLN